MAANWDSQGRVIKKFDGNPLQKHVNEYIQRTGVSQYWIAKRCRFSSANKISRLCTGENIPTLAASCAIIDALHLPVSIITEMAEYYKKELSLCA